MYNSDESENITGIPTGLPTPVGEATGRLEDFDTQDDVIPWVIEFRVVGTPDIIHVPVKESLMIGRLDQNRGIDPDVDLGGYNARQSGVSRQHARIIAKDNRITLEDLNSSNGTAVNGRKIAPNQPFRLREGDTIRLGTLQLQIHFVVKPHAIDDTIDGLGNDFDIPRIANGQHLLIVDENHDVTRVLQYITMVAGFQATITHSMMDAITALNNVQYAGIIVEVMLPDGSGIDVIKYARNKVSDTMPIIATGTPGYRHNQAIEAGATVLVEKPIVVDDLMHHLGKLIELMQH